MRTPDLLRGLVVGAVLAVAVTGCSAGSASGTSAASASSAPSASTAPSPAVPTPADAVSLAALGFENGPVDRVFVPVGARLQSRVDQTNAVTLVLVAPPAADLADFYRRTVPGDGFTLTGDDPATATLTFSGFGWTGTFTGDSRASALLLRPAG